MADVVTDGVFEAVTEGSEKVVASNDRDFSGAGNWTTVGVATLTINYDSGDGGHDSTLRIQAGDASLEGASLPANAGSVTEGKTYVLTFDYKYIETTDILLASTRVRFLVGADSQLVQGMTLSTSWVENNKIYYTAGATGNVQFIIYCSRSSGHADNELLIDNLSFKPVTFTSWNDAADGFAPGTDGSGNLTNKANAVAGTASNLEQDVSAVAGGAYVLVFTVTNRTAGSVTPQIGGVDGTARSSDATFTEEILATGTGNLKFQKDTTFDGSIDTVTITSLGVWRHRAGIRRARRL